ncbi:MAG: LysR family transcriptional regulator [Pseudomonadota bacterium]
MNKTDYLALDGNSIRTFLTVLEEESVSKAAERLGISQSAVSHSLEKLRAVFDDPLFVRSGRGIKATERAIELKKPAEQILENLKFLMHKRSFDPQKSLIELTVAANDFQRNLIFPRLCRAWQASNIQSRVSFIPSGIPNTEMLRRRECDLMITPFPPEGPDIFQIKLFDDKIIIFYDSRYRKAPLTLEEFRKAQFVEVLFNGMKTSLCSLPKEQLKHLQLPVISVPTFDAVKPFILGGPMITAAASSIKNCGFEELDTAQLPFEAPSINMYLVWHKRDHKDPAHQWIRMQIIETVDAVLQEINPS